MSLMIKDTFPMIIGEEKVRSERTLLAGVENGKYMTSADSVRFAYLLLGAIRSDKRRTSIRSLFLMWKNTVKSQMR